MNKRENHGRYNETMQRVPTKKSREREGCRKYKGVEGKDGNGHGIIRISGVRR